MAKKVKHAIREPSCVRAVVLTYPNGTIRHLVVSCGRWGCPECAERKVGEVLMQIKVAADGGDVFAAEIPEGKRDAVRKMAMRKASGYVGIKRWDGSALFVASIALSGRGWELAPMSPDELQVAVLSRGVSRVDWSKNWRPERPERKHVVGRAFCSPGRVDKVLRAVGYDDRKGRIPGMTAAESAALITEACAASAPQPEKSLLQGREKSLVQGRKRRRRKVPSARE